MMCIRLVFALMCSYTVHGGVVLRALPPTLTPGTDISLTCFLRVDPGVTRVDDVYTIIIGKDGKILAGISDAVSPNVAYRVRWRARATGRLNHTHVEDAFLAMTLNSTGCSDAGLYHCAVTVKQNAIIRAVKNSLNYSLPGAGNLSNEEVARLCTPTKPVNAGFENRSVLKYSMMIVLLADHLFDWS